jgi:hypothetical protein
VFALDEYREKFSYAVVYVPVNTPDRIEMINDAFSNQFIECSYSFARAPLS